MGYNRGVAYNAGVSDKSLTILAKIAIYGALMTLFGFIGYGLFFRGGAVILLEDVGEKFREYPLLMWPFAAICVYGVLKSLRR